MSISKQMFACKVSRVSTRVYNVLQELDVLRIHHSKQCADDCCSRSLRFSSSLYISVPRRRPDLSYPMQFTKSSTTKYSTRKSNENVIWNKIIKQHFSIGFCATHVVICARWTIASTV